MRAGWLPASLLASLLFTLSSTLSADSGCGGAAAADAAENVQDASPALRVQIDPVTGELIDRPLPAAPSVPADQSAAAPIPVYRRPDGMLVADVGNRFMSETRVEIVDGEVITCHRPVTPVDPPAAAADHDPAGSANHD